MSSGGPSSTASASVYATSGNGPFACSSAVSSQCTVAANVVYWGETMIKFPSANSSNPVTPTDFYAPNKETFTIKSNGDPYPSAYETGELSRLDLDFGSTPAVIVPFTSAPEYALSADKSGYMYVVPAEVNGTGVTVSMGQFTTNDAALTSGAVSTQLPFQASQQPISPNTGNPICPLNTNGSPWTNNGTACDEIHEIAFLNNLAIVWPLNEAIEAYSGTLTKTGTGGSATYNYQFNTTPSLNPCPAPYTSLPIQCTGTNPNFPGAGTGAPVGAMAIASTPGSGGVPTATLWGITTEPSKGTWGWLYAYGVDSTPASPSITYLWDSGTGLNNCSLNSKAYGWIATSFTEPTLAAGAAYVPTICAVTGTSTQYSGCGQVPSSHIASGVLVFKACP